MKKPESGRNKENGGIQGHLEEAKSTTWLHPVTGETILTGHRRTPDLPTGWEEAYTFEGARYYIK
ncbi:uncharacterized protein PAF06_009180 [Gastrophryne carolinensis]